VRVCNARLHPRRGLRGLAIFAVAVAAALAGCSIQKNYKTLSFFFDGVPDPNAPAPSAGNEKSFAPSLATPAAARMFRHKPYAEQKCAECHTPDKKQLVALKGELCLKCHQKQATQYPVMHAPMAAGQCLWCHEPHESDLPRLLKTTAPELCLQCHDRDLLPARIAEHQSEKANCLTCHLGHGGVKRSMLRADNPLIQAVPLESLPATQPAAEEDARRHRGGTP